MDHDEWEWHSKKARDRLHFQGGMSHFRARQLGHEITERRFGPQPEEPKKEVKMSQFVSKLIVSLVFGIGATGAALTVALGDGVITGPEWMALAGILATTFWGKFSSNTRFLAPSRKGETVAGPK